MCSQTSFAALLLTQQQLWQVMLLAMANRSTMRRERSKQLLALHQALHHFQLACVLQFGHLYSRQPACHIPHFLGN